MTIDELTDAGMAQMTDDEIRGFLSSQHVGVLALPTDGAPSMRPLSFWYDGDHGLYFLYILGDSSRKALLSDEAAAARFLVYRAEALFNWRSVLLTGTIDAVPETERAALDAKTASQRRPDLFKQALATAETALYRFDITEWTGVEHLGLPAGFEEPTSTD
ncbi:pyridoxamine 5'-phosphate oxidase family protein [Haladaptatus sp. GCM10025707]|uniref:pyridoxamine 5'-phosphate oxidase family protein n=1 Tax=unclassified Haladaptatus TaxID=2622732 RepID=UPI0023E840CE|nr:pyridoxamine 5'-phosphate oxidase family protein [Haladaptatus sp. QDMS2]